MKMFKAELLLFGCALTMCICAPQYVSSLDVEDFEAEYQLIDILPIQKISTIMFTAFALDPEVRKTVIYLRSDEFVAISKNLEKTQAVGDLVEYLRESGWNLDKLMNRIRQKLFYHSEYTEEESDEDSLAEYVPSGGMNGAIEKVFTTLGNLRNCFYHKLINDTSFIEKIKKLSSNELWEKVQNVRDTPEYKKFVEKLYENNIDFDRFVNLALEAIQSHF